MQHTSNRIPSETFAAHAEQLYLLQQLTPALTGDKSAGVDRLTGNRHDPEEAGHDPAFFEDDLELHWRAIGQRTVRAARS
jgi:hypothetical protein